jgi:hypothetical protein
MVVMNGFSNKNSIRMQTLFVVLILFTLSAGCQGSLLRFCRSPVLAASSLSIPPGEPVPGSWKGREVGVNYTIVRTQDRLDISGFIGFDQSMYYNFSQIRDFSMRIHFIDSQGAIIKTEGLLVAAYAYPDRQMEFSTVKNIPPGAEGIAFSYTGTAYSDGDDRVVASFFDGPC